MPDGETIPALFARQAAVLGRRPLFFVKHQGAYQSISWQQAQADVAALTAFLLSRGVTPGDRVLILSENRPEWGVADLAIQSAGAWSVPMYPSLTAQQLNDICQDCQPALCIASTPDQAKKLLTVCETHRSGRLILAMDPAPPHPLLIGWAEALAAGRGLLEPSRALCEQRRCAIRPDDTATLIYTSGTTGEPKGVMLSHRNFLSNVDACLQILPIRADDLHLSFLPLSHVFERMAGWYLMLRIGASVAYAETMETIPENMLEVRPTIVLGVPRFFEKLYAGVLERIRHAQGAKRRIAEWALAIGRTCASRRAAGQRVPIHLALQRWAAHQLVFKKIHAGLGGRLRFFVSGGAPLSKEIGEFFDSVGVTILEGYGLTETSPVIAVNRLERPRFGSVGPLLPGVEVAIADDGEILTRGPHVMQGYYHKPDATSAAIVEGWFHTGDIGHLDADGCLRITDRKKDLLKTAGGKFVSPQKLENLFIADPYISQAFVYGDRRPYCVALIVPHLERLRRWAQEQEIAAPSLGALIQHERIRAFYWDRVQTAQQGLAGFEQVKKIALLGEEFSQAAGELTPTLKAKRTIIAQRHQPLLDSLYQA